MTGCGGGGVRDHIGTVEDEVVVCAKGPTVEGVDVSTYQGKIDWNKVKASGKVFAVARIGDGLGGDDQWAANWPGIKAAGMIRGAYQFFRPGDDPTAMANIVVSKVGMLGDGDLPVMCDVEATDGQSAATIIAKMHTWMNVVEKGTGKKPLVYTGKYFWQDNVADTKEFNDHVLWIAAYGPTCPNLPDGAWSDWGFFQYTDAESVPGISGNVDGDKFNGTLADLQALAGGGPDYAAQFVSQSWPYATTTFSLVTGQEQDAYIEFKNVGKKAWDSNTRLATTVKRDRKSPFYGSSWVSDTRVAQVKGSVPPGSSFKFQFKWHAPAMTGMYDEHFGLVEDGVAWFGDQGGPADDVVEAKINVIQAKYAAQFVSQTFPTSDTTLTMHVGEKVDGTITLKNIGSETWKAGETKLAPTPRDKASPLGATNWLSSTRISSPIADVPPGGSFAFPVTLTANAVGDTMQTFGVVDEGSAGAAWFADAPDGGGPADDFLKVHVVVVENGVDIDAGASVSVDGGELQAQANADANGSCGCETAGKTGGSSGWLLLGLLALRRRRAN